MSSLVAVARWLMLLATVACMEHVSGHGQTSMWQPGTSCRLPRLMQASHAFRFDETRLASDAGHHPDAAKYWHNAQTATDSPIAELHGSCMIIAGPLYPVEANM